MKHSLFLTFRHQSLPMFYSHLYTNAPIVFFYNICIIQTKLNNLNTIYPKFAFKITRIKLSKNKYNLFIIHYF